MSRTDSSLADEVNRRFEQQFLQAAPGAPIDLVRVCDDIRSKDSWLVIVANTKLRSDNKFRRYFQTSTDDRGIFLEYDGPEQGNLRVGIGTTTNAQLTRIRTVRRDEHASILIAVTPTGLRVLLNGVDRAVPWPTNSGFVAACDSLAVFAVASLECSDCDATLRYATGNDLQRLEADLDSVSDVSQMNRRRWVGSSLVLLGFTVIVLPATAISRLRRRLDTSSVGVESSTGDR